jgi:glyoxylase-like metal-dependent hydrolase (beta-lactamase superfamily II)
MYRGVVPQLKLALKKLSPADIRIIINTHFHGDHIQGNMVLSHSAVIISHENVFKRLNSRPGADTTGALPHVLITDSATVHFNGEDIRLLHFPNGHTDTDLFVWFTKSGVIHMGDTYFNGMFPAVYKEGGGDILQMIRNLEKILPMLPENIKVIPGHGDLATKADLQAYVTMLKETTSAVQAAIKAGKSLDDVQKAKLIQKYDQLGSGGAQTTEQYTAMLYKLLS